MTNKLSNQQLRDILKRTCEPTDGEDADRFWERFCARAAMTPQTDEQPAANRRPRMLGWRVVLPAAAALLLAVAGVWMEHGPMSGDTAVAVNDAATEDTEPALPEVQEIELYVDCEGVMIMEDQENGGTVLLLADAGTDPAS